MRIRRIEIENLASLRGRQPSLALAGGQQDGDPDDSNLSDAGLVAITGATGAGKTTILDAVCLALFDQTPRLKDRGQDPRELLSRGAGEGSATVELQLDDGRRWIVEWSVHRARNQPDGNLQASRRRIVDAVTGQTVADGKTDVAMQVESGLGLDFDQFTGVILLAQGEFAKFLEAGDADRSQLLERLTGTEIYSRLSRAAFERHRERQDAVRGVTERLQDVRTLDDERRRAVEEELDHLAPRLIGLQRRLDDLEEQRQWFERLDALRRQGSASAGTLAEAETAWDAAAGDRSRLDRAERASLLAAPMESAAASRRGAREAEAAVKDSRRALEAAREERTGALASLSASLRRFDVHRRSVEDTFTAVEGFAAATDDAVEAFRDSLRTCRDGGRRVAELRRQIAALAGQIDDAESLAKEHEVGRAESARRVGELREEQAGLATRRDELTGGRSPERLKERQIRLEQALQVHKEFAQLDLDTLRQEEKAARATVRKAQRAVDKARQAAAERREDLEHHETVLELAIERAKLGEHRHVLVDGEPCPLCGADDHPWAEHPPDETSAALESARSRAEKLKQALDDARVHLDEAVALQSAAAAEVIRLEERVEAADRSIKSLLGSWMELRFLVSELPEKPTDFEPDGPKAEAAELKQTLEDLRPIEESAERVDATVHQAEQVLHRHETQLEVVRERMDGLRTRREELAISESETVDRLREDLDSLSTVASDLAASCALDPAEPPGHELLPQLGPFENLLQRVADGRAAFRRAEDQRRRAREVDRGVAARGRDLLADLELDHVTEEVPQDFELSELADDLDERLRHAESADGRCRVLQDRLQGAETTRKTASERRDEADAKLRDALNGSPFGDEAELREASLDGDSMRRLRGRLDELNQTKIRRGADDERSRAELAAHRELAPVEVTDDAEEEAALRRDLASDLDAARQRHRETGDRHKSLEIELAKDDSEREKLKSLSGELEHLEAARDRAARLYDLIGHKKGDKFRRFAQQLNLDQLLELANLRLELLEPRYSLARRDEGLDLEVIDRDMADERRPVTTLSGGESFLVSLALALALADLRRGTLELGTLFLDEGFGSLDEDTLDQALAVLEQLQADQQTQILVISHVGALQERIAHRIDVRKRGGGRSELRVNVAG